MNKELSVKDVINTKYAVAAEDGEKVYQELNTRISKNQVPVIIDFEGITRTTTAFFNSSISVFLKDYDANKLNSYLNFKNLNKTSQILLQNSIKIAKIRFKENSELDKVIREELKSE